MTKEVTEILAEMGIPIGKTVPAETVEAIEAALTWARKWRSVAQEPPPRNEYMLISVDGVCPSGCLAYCDDAGIWRTADGGAPFNRQDLVVFWRPL